MSSYKYNNLWYNFTESALKGRLNSSSDYQVLATWATNNLSILFTTAITFKTLISKGLVPMNTILGSTLDVVSSIEVGMVAALVLALVYDDVIYK